MKTKMANSLLKLPTPSSISYMWNFGSILGLSLLVQIVTGVFLSMHYSSDMLTAFSKVVHINIDVNNGFFIRFIHANGATLFFVAIYLHISRGLYYKSYAKSPLTWVSGVTIYFSFMGTAFLGYVLPWGQMSYWGATVITNLISAIPYVGSMLVEWIWGGFSVGGPTLSRFYSLHFLLPIVGAMLVMIHIILLHETGSSNPLGLSKNSDKVTFHPFFTLKDTLGFHVFTCILLYLANHSPLLFMDPDNFIEANPLVTPVHIQPEWYFLFAYAILRSIPNKLGGVIGLMMSIVVLYFLPLVKKADYLSKIGYQVSCLMIFMSFTILTFLGAMPVEAPFSMMGSWTSLMYFLSFIFMIV